MISYLPEIYPDELVYSWFCRYYVHSGCFTHKMALDDILHNRHNNPSKEFVGHLSSEAKEKIQTIYSLEKLVLEHTMFPQYARFLPSERKKSALHHLAYDFCDAHQLFAILPRTENDRFLKYCPECVEEDRKTYGETYWHRIHQIRNLTICPMHNCLLNNSSVTSISSQAYTLCPAEEYTLAREATVSENAILSSFNRYLADVFNAPFDLETDLSISTIFHHALKNTLYLSKNEKMHYPKRLADDIKQYYFNTGISNVASFSQIQKTLNGESFDFSVVCQIAFYLNIPPNDLLSTKTLSETPSVPHRTKEKILDWNSYDEELLPILERTAQDIYSGRARSDGRPERVSERLIYQKLNLSAHRLEKLPQCRAVLARYSESYEESWARRIIWSYQKLKAKCPNTPVFWSDIRNLAGVKRQNIEKVMPFLANHTDKTTYNAILRIIR